MEETLISQSPDHESSPKPAFRKPSNDPSHRKYRRHSPISGSPSPGVEKCERSASPIGLEESAKDSGSSKRPKRNDDQPVKDRDYKRDEFQERHSYGHGRDNERGRGYRHGYGDDRDFQHYRGRGHDSRGGNRNSRRDYRSGRSDRYSERSHRDREFDEGSKRTKEMEIEREPYRSAEKADVNASTREEGEIEDERSRDDLKPEDKSRGRDKHQGSEWDNGSHRNERLHHRNERDLETYKDERLHHRIERDPESLKDERQHHRIERDPESLKDERQHHRIERDPESLKDERQYHRHREDAREHEGLRDKYVKESEHYPKLDTRSSNYKDKDERRDKELDRHHDRYPSDRENKRGQAASDGGYGEEKERRHRVDGRGHRDEGRERERYRDKYERESERHPRSESRGFHDRSRGERRGRDWDRYSDRDERNSKRGQESERLKELQKKTEGNQQAEKGKSSTDNPKSLSRTHGVNDSSNPNETETDAVHDLNAAKMAAMKAAEIVNKNLGAAGIMTADQKKKLLWGSKKSTKAEESGSGNVWDAAHFDDPERQEKFNKLMSLSVPCYIWPIVGCERRSKGRRKDWRDPCSRQTARGSGRFGKAIYCWVKAQRWPDCGVRPIDGLCLFMLGRLVFIKGKKDAEFFVVLLFVSFIVFKDIKLGILNIIHSLLVIGKIKFQYFWPEQYSEMFFVYAVTFNCSCFISLLS